MLYEAALAAWLSHVCWCLRSRRKWLGESRTAGESAGGWGPASEDTDATAAVTSWSSLAEIQ
jgi:hypothetical protein